MKTLRSAVALGSTLALVLLSPGMNAWARVAAVGRVAPNSVAAPAGAAALHGVPVAFLPVAVMSPSYGSVGRVPTASGGGTPSPYGSVAADAVLSAAPPASAAEAVDVAPAASALEGIRREMPDFAGLSAGESKNAASADFMSRIGEKIIDASEASVITVSERGAEGRAPSLTGYSRRDSAPVPGASGRSLTTFGGGTSSPYGSVGRSAALFGALPAFAMAAAAGASIVQPLVTLPLVMISLILHEIGHAKAAARLGDPTATLRGRASFNPLKWVGHVDPVMTIIVPMMTYLLGGVIFGGAKAVPVDQSYFKNPAADMAKVAVAGPAVNLALAGLGALAYALAAAGGLGAPVLGAATAFVFINALLAVFNMVPVRPLDGGHVLAALLPPRVAASLDAVYARLGWLPVIAIAILGGGAIMGLAAGLTQLLIGASFAATGVQLAGAALPAMAALGLALGSARIPSAERPVELGGKP